MPQVLNGDSNIHINVIPNGADAVKKLAGNISALEDRLKAIARLTNEINRHGSVAGVAGDLHKGSAQLKQYQAVLQRVGATVNEQAHDWRTLINHQKTLTAAMKKTGLVGIATGQSLKLGTEAGATGFIELTSRVDRFRVRMHALRGDLIQLTTLMKSKFQNSQWLGRQMMVGLSVPLALFGSQAVSAFRDLEQEQVRLKKVFFDVGDSIEHQARVFDTQLAPAIDNVSRKYGQTRQITTALMADWAQFGTTSTQELKALTDITSQFALLGDIDLDVATPYVRSVFATFGENDIQKTVHALQQMNAVENATALSTNDLAESLPEIASVAMSLNIPIDNLAGSLAAMANVGIPVNEAVHGLKFGLQRLASPTEKAKEVMNAFHISLFNADGSAKNITDVLIDLATKLRGASDETRSYAMTQIFGARQASRMGSMLDDLVKHADGARSAFADATEAAGGDVAGVAEKEMAAVRASTGFQLTQLHNRFKMFMEDLGATLAQPLIRIMKGVQKLMDAFSRLNPHVKAFFVGMLALVATIGPVIYIFSQMGLAVSTVAHFTALLLPRMKMVEAATAKAALASGEFKGKMIQIGDSFVLAQGKLGHYTEGLLEHDAAAQVNLASTREQIIEEMRLMDIRAASAQNQMMWDERVMAIEAEADLAHRVTGQNRGALRTQIAARTPMPDFIQMPAPGTSTSAAAAEAEVAAEAATSATTKTTTKVERLREALRSTRTTSKGMWQSVVGAFTSIASAIRHPLSLIDKIKTALGGVRSMFAGFSRGGGIGKMASNFGGMASGASKFAKVTVVIGLVIAAVTIAIKGLQKHWASFYDKMKPGIDSIKDAWNGLWNALKDIGAAFKPIIDGFSKIDDSAAGTDAGGFWEAMGHAIRGVLEVIGGVIDAIAFVVRNIAPPIQAVAELIGTIVGMIAEGISSFVSMVSAIIHGDWGDVWDIALDMVRQFAQGIASAIELAVDSILLAVRYIIEGLSEGVNLVSWLVDKLPGDNPIEGWADGVQRAADSIDELRAGSFTDAIFGDSFDYGYRSGGEYVDGWSESARRNHRLTVDTGRQIADDTRDGILDPDHGPEEVANEWMDGWLSAVQSALQGIMDDLKTSALKALNDAFEKDLAVYDAQIEAIEKVEKAEAKRFAREEYLQRRHEMLRNRALQFENYSRDRALAIYEGRIDDARMMDLEEQKNRQDHVRSLNDLEESRRRDLIQQARDEEKERIKIAKDAAKERQDLLRESFERQLDIIMRYAPRTVGEFNNMLSSISGALRNAGVNVWPGHARTGMALYAQAIQRANTDLRQQAAWSGNNAATAWLAAFVAGDVRAGLQAASATQPPDIPGLRGSNGPGGRNGGRGGSGNRTPGFRPGQMGSRDNGPLFHTGGKVPGQAARDVPATLQSGEYVVQRKAAKAVGAGFLDQINNAHAKTPKFHEGGQVGNLSPQNQMKRGMKDFVTDLSAAWMYNQVAIGGLTSGAVAYLFQSLGAKVGGKTLADVMPSGHWANIDEFAKWITSLPQFQGITYGGTPGTGGMARPQNPSSDHPRGFAADFFNGGGTSFNPKLESLFQFLGAGGKSGTLPTKYAIYFDRDISANTGWAARGPTTSYDRHLDHVHLSVLDSIAQFGDAAGGFAGPMATGPLQEMVRGMMAQFGWGGDQWGPLNELIAHESSWNPNAQNPGSSAYGLFQFMDDTWGNYGFHKSSDPRYQTTAGLTYIKRRYGNPAAAWDFWQRTDPRPIPGHWYHKGGQVNPLVPMMAGGKIPHDNFPASLHKGEIVLPQPIAKNITAMADKHDTMGGTTVNIYADTFMGDFEWFKKQCARYDIEVVPRKKAAAGTTVRRVRSRAGV